VRDLLWKAIPTALFVCAVAVQLFGPRPIGKSDNGDFPKVLGPIGVWVSPDFRADLFSFFVTDFRIDDTHIWNPNTPSSEVWIAAAARKISERILPPGRFDIRVLGALHAALAAIAFWLCLLPLENLTWPRRAMITLLFLLVFADPQYVQFFSTAYMDEASIVFLMLVFAAGWNAVLGDPGWRWGILFCVFGCLFLGTKLQHQPCVMPFALFCLAMAWRAGTSRRAGRIVWLLTPAALLSTSLFMYLQTYTGYRVEPLFSAVFFKLLPLSRNPELALHELNRPAADIAYNHMWAYSEGSPLRDPVYRAAFQRDVTTGSVLSFYRQHPKIAVEVLRSDFLSFAADVPISSFGTMRRIDNPTPLFRANGPQPWSAFRRQAASLWPWHIPILYVVVPLFSLFLGSRIWPLALAVCAVGMFSFAAGSLLDATETSRHIILYQEATDLLYIITFYLIIRTVDWGSVRMSGI
jgi:hypothetical protein